MNNRNFALLWAIALVSLLFGTSVACIAGPSNTAGSNAGSAANSMKKPDCILTLSKADKFYGPTPGESGPSETQRAYREATGMAGQFETDDLNWLLKNGTPAGRIYGAVLLWQSGRVGPNLSYALLVNDKSKVDYQDGCKVIGVTVNEIAQSLMEKQSYMNFQVGSMFCKLKAPVEKPVAPQPSVSSPQGRLTAGKPFPKPACIIQLHKATSFDSGAVGEGAESANWKAFKEARSRLKEESILIELDDLLEHSTPAGKIYGAILLYESGKFGLSKAFEKLKNDNSKVACRSGCEVENTTVAKVAQSFVERSHYNDFKLSVKTSTQKVKSYGYGTTYGRSLSSTSSTLVCPGCLPFARRTQGNQFGGSQKKKS